MPMVEYYEPSGQIVRYDTTTGANLWVANHTVAIVMCSLSVLGALSVIISFILFKRVLKTFIQRLILCLSLSDLVLQFLHLIDHAHNLRVGRIINDWFCQFTGWYLGSLLVANALWVGVFCWYLHKQIVRGKREHLRIAWLFLFAFGFPCVYHVIPLFDSSFASYGPRSNWCYISNDHPVALNLFLPAPVYVTFAFVACLYAHIIFTIRQKLSGFGDQNTAGAKERKKARLRVQQRLLGYPTIFLFQWLSLLIEFAMVWGGASDYSVTIVDIFTVSTVNSSGILNAIWFWYNESIVDKYRKILRGEAIVDSKKMNTSTMSEKAAAEDSTTDVSNV